jgi:single-stranded DNA-specific DHH superfamily exonuclease
LYALELFSEPGDLEARNLTLDLNLPFDLIDDKFLQYLALFEPHGIGNNKPVFFAPDVLMSDSRAIGKNSSHLRATFTNGSQTWQAIGWGFGEYSTFGGQRFDLAYRFKRNVATYGRLYGSSLELEIIDLQVRSSN